MMRLESVSDCVRGIAAAGVQCTSKPCIVSRSKLHHTYLTMYVVKIRNVKLDLCSMCCTLFVYSRIPAVVVAVLVLGRGGDELFWSTHQTPPSPTTTPPLETRSLPLYKYSALMHTNESSSMKKETLWMLEIFGALHILVWYGKRVSTNMLRYSFPTGTRSVVFKLCN